jgi:pectate lyase
VIRAAHLSPRARIHALISALLAVLVVGCSGGPSATPPSTSEADSTTTTEAPTTTKPPAPICSAIGDRMSRSLLLDEVDGFARVVETNGAGLDGQVFIVTSTADHGAGTLREGLEQGGRWVVFDKSVFANDREVTINVESPILIGANTTLDGRCANVRLDGSSGTDGILFVGDYGRSGTSNVMITNVKVGPAPGEGGAQSGDGIRVTWGSDRIFISHVEIYSAHDEAIQFDRGDRGPMRGTVSYSLIRDTQKAVLIGDGTTNNEKRGGWATNAHRIQVTFHDNWFLRNQIRNPAVTDSSAHIYNNYISEYGVPNSTENGAGIEAIGNAWVWAENNVIEQASPGGDFCGLEAADYRSLGVTGSTYLNDTDNTFRGIAKTCAFGPQPQAVPSGPPYDYKLDDPGPNGDRLVERLTNPDVTSAGRAGWVQRR